MTSAPADPAPSPDPELVYCVAHPSVETALRCGRCERPICPRCMVFTPGGIRCPDCAMLRRPPMYEVTPMQYAQAIGAAAAVAIGLGIVGALLLPLARSIPFFGLMISIFAGVGAGTVMAEAISRATRGKRGLGMQIVALAAILAAGAIRLTLVGALAFVLQDLLGLLMVAVAMAAAWQRLR